MYHKAFKILNLNCRRIAGFLYKNYSNAFKLRLEDLILAKIMKHL